jgi:hypothetical protein
LWILAKKRLTQSDQGNMDTKRFVLAGLLVCFLFGQSEPGLQPSRIRFKSAARGPAERQQDPWLRTGAESHYIVEFDTVPRRSDVAGLEKAGARVIGYAPDTALVISAPDDMEWRATVPFRRDRLAPARKLSPLLRPDAESYLIEFHPDVAASRVDQVLERTGVRPIANGSLLPNHRVVLDHGAAAARSLACWDEVAYVFPAEMDLVLGHSVYACAGPLVLGLRMAQFSQAVGAWSGGVNGIALQYFFGQPTAKLPISVAQAEVLRALYEWGRYIDLHFTPAWDATRERTITVLWASRSHGDSYPFDGPGKTLAHTFFPAPPNGEPVAGDMHFDEEETWRVAANIDLYSVALHETGHALGLGHSDQPGTLMYPYYRLGAVITPSDVAAIQQLYPAFAISPGSPRPTQPPSKNLALTMQSPPGPLATLAPTIDASGMVEGGASPVSVRWSSDRGGSGLARVSGQQWTAAAIPLAVGANTIVVTAADSQNRTSSKSVVVTRAQSARPRDTQAPSMKITSPASTVVATSARSIQVRGTAQDNVSVSSVTWSNSAGSRGVASGTTDWTSNIALVNGTNLVTIRVFDAAGNSVWRSLTVVRR